MAFPQSTTHVCVRVCVEDFSSFIEWKKWLPCACRQKKSSLHEASAKGKDDPSSHQSIKRAKCHQ